MTGVDPATRVRAELSAKRSAAGRKGALSRWSNRTVDDRPGSREAHWCGIENQTGGAADIYIYGQISRWDVNAKDFAEQLKGIKGNTINVFINSVGGSVWEGLPILNGLRRHPATINVTVDGIAASAASWIAMAGDEIVMSPNSQMMIHDALSLVDVLTLANAADLDQIIEDMSRLRSELERLSDDIAGIYAGAAGARNGSSSVAHWRQLMIDETWFFAEEAVAAGLADRVDGQGDGAGNAATVPAADDDQSIQTHFRYSSRDEAPGPPTGTTDASPSNADPDPFDEIDGDQLVASLEEALA